MKFVKILLYVETWGTTVPSKIVSNSFFTCNDFNYIIAQIFMDFLTFDELSISLDEKRVNIESLN